MIIHPPEIIAEKEHTILLARMERKNREGFFPEVVWYRVPNRYGSFFSTQSDAFLVTGLLAAMYFGEDMDVRGNVSPRLVYQLDEYQHLLYYRFPRLLKPVRIRYRSIRPLSSSPHGVGTTFTGGVDSLFTLYKHLPQDQTIPDYKLTHALFIKGFDILPSESSHYAFLLEKFDAEARKIGIDLIPIETNMVSITHQRMPLPFFYGPIIISAGLALSGLFKRFFIPSSWDYHKLEKKAYTSDPMMDRLLSTDTLDVINHGTTHRRVEKVKEIAGWETAQKLLWVCEVHQFKENTWNCSRCEKCMRTMIPLYALGYMNQYSSFARPIRSDRDGLWWARKFSLRQNYAAEILPFVKQHKPEFLPWLRLASLLGTLRYWLLVRLMPGFVKKWSRRFGYFTQKNEAPDAYEDPFVSQVIKEKHDHSPT